MCTRYWSRAVLAVLLWVAAGAARGEGDLLEISKAEAKTTDAGSAMSFLVNVTEGELLKIDFWRCGVDSWSDDRGTNLGEKKSDEFCDTVTFMSEWTKEGRRMSMLGKVAPAEEAESVEAKGALIFWLGHDLQTGTTDDVTLVDGGTFEVGDLAFHVKNVKPGESAGGEKMLEFTLTFTTEKIYCADFMKTFVFRDAEGEKIDSTRANYQGYEAKGEHVMKYRLKTEQTEVSVDWEYYEKTTRHEQKFSVEADLKRE